MGKQDQQALATMAVPTSSNANDDETRAMEEQPPSYESLFPTTPTENEPVVDWHLNPGQGQIQWPTGAIREATRTRPFDVMLVTFPRDEDYDGPLDESGETNWIVDEIADLWARRDDPDWTPSDSEDSSGSDETADSTISADSASSADSDSSADSVSTADSSSSADFDDMATADSDSSDIEEERREPAATCKQIHVALQRMAPIKRRLETMGVTTDQGTWKRLRTGGLWN